MHLVISEEPTGGYGEGDWVKAQCVVILLNVCALLLCYINNHNSSHLLTH